MKVAFFGTPEPAVASLEALFRGAHRVVAVITAPDRPAGRGMGITESAVKSRALEAGLEVLQPKTLKSAEAAQQLSELGADVFVVCAYGRILPQPVLDAPALGCLNVHFSMLPRLRGAAPVVWALLEGYEVTGVSIMQMDSGMDTGPVLAQRPEQIRLDDTAGSLESRLAGVGADLLMEGLERLEIGDVEPVPQDESLATYAPKVGPELARIDWTSAASDLFNRVRAFNPKPGAWTRLRGSRLKIWRASVSNGPSRLPGEVHLDGERILVTTGTGSLVLKEVQPEGRRRMTAAEFARGYRLGPQDRFE